MMKKICQKIYWSLKNCWVIVILNNQKMLLVYMKKELIDADYKIWLFLIVDLFIDKKNIKTGSNNITLRKVNVKPYGSCMDKDSIEN